MDPNSGTPFLIFCLCCLGFVVFDAPDPVLKILSIACFFRRGFEQIQFSGTLVQYSDTLVQYSDTLVQYSDTAHA